MFKYLQNSHFIYYYALEKSVVYIDGIIQRSDSIFKLYEVNLHKNGSYREIEEMRKVIPDEYNKLAVQISFIKYENNKIFRQNTLNEINDENFDLISYLS